MKKLVLLLLTSSINFCFAQSRANDAWSSITANGFNNQNHHTSIASLKEFNGWLYAGCGGSSISNPDTARLYKSQTGNPGTWILALSAWEETINPGISNNLFTVMENFGGNLYIGGNTANITGKVYKTSDGITFRSFWNVDTKVSSILAFKGTAANDSIFIIRDGGSSDEIYKADPNTNDSFSLNLNSFKLTKVFPSARVTTAKVITIGGVQTLFVATKGTSYNDAFLYKSTDGITFTLIGDLNVSASNIFNGNNPLYNGISCIGQNGNTLYFGTKGDQATPTDYFSSNDGGNTWTRVNFYTGYDEMPVMYNHNNELWFALADRYTFGTNRIKIHRGLNGSNISYSSNNLGHASNYGVNGCMEYFKNNLFYGFENTSIGGQLHRLSFCTFSVTGTANPSSICNGTPSLLMATPVGGTAPYTYTWTDGVTPVTGQNVLVSPTASFTTYTLTATDGLGCPASYTVGVTATPSTDITVTLKDQSGNPVNNATVNLYKDTSTVAGIIKLYVPHTTTTNSAGTYTLTGVDAGNYWIKAFPDNVIYPTIIPTFYGDEFQWDSIKVTGRITHGCSQIDNFIINMIELHAFTFNGTGKLRGIIKEDQGFHKSFGDPIPGVDIKLGRKPPGGSIIATTTTNSLGTYEFNNIPNNILPTDSFAIYVDIPGYHLDSSITVHLSPGNNQFLQLNYYVDSTNIYPDTNSYVAIDEPTINNTLNYLNVFPNPSNGNATIKYNILREGQATLGIYDVLGMRLEELVNTKQQPGEYNLKFDYTGKYPPGSYFIVLNTNSNTTIYKIVITK